MSEFIESLKSPIQPRIIEYSEARLLQCAEEAAAAILLDNAVCRASYRGVTGLRWQKSYRDQPLFRRQHVFALLVMSCRFIEKGRAVKPPTEIVDVLLAGEPRHIFPAYVKPPAISYSTNVYRMR